jgi:hypothetical protein
MAHITPPPADALPSPARLRRASLACVAIAIVLAVVVVLPAERAIDVTGLGRVLGLTEMGMIKLEFKAELAAEAAQRAAKHIADSTVAAEKAAVLQAVASGTKPARTDTVAVAVKPGEELRVLLQMQKKAWAIYSWSANRGAVEYDIRGDSAGDEDWRYHRYEAGGPVATAEGVLVAKFNGVHGWYWRNTGDSTVSVTLLARGNYDGVTK